MHNILYLVVPCYNEEEVLPDSAVMLEKKLTQLISERVVSRDSRILFIDDGSKDSTWQIVEELHSKSTLFRGLKLSRNRGHQNALLAGLLFAAKYADITISLDADLQDDLNSVDAMLREWKKGSDIVYGVRNIRTSDSMFKRHTAIFFYKLMARLGAESVYNHADFRLMTARVLHELENFKETNLFLRGIVPLLGFKTSTIEYSRSKRVAGNSKYPLKKMINFAIDGITSFSVKPLRIVTTLGFIVSLISFVVMGYSLIAKFAGYTVEGWTFTVISVWFIGGVQMLSIGIVGEYIGKIYNEVKARPRYIVEKEL